VGDLGNVDRGRVTALIANVYGIGWRVLLPLSGAFELSALVMFLRAVSAHRVQPGEKADQRWVLIVLAGTLGLVAVLGMNLFEGVRLAINGSGPAFPPDFDQRLLAVMAWGFMVPFVWGFSTKWLPVFLGLRPTKIRLMLAATTLNIVGLATYQAEQRFRAHLLFGSKCRSARKEFSNQFMVVPKNSMVKQYAGYPGIVISSGRSL